MRGIHVTFHYLDSAVLVKLLVREPDSEFLGNMTDGESISSSVLAYTEVWSAFLAKERAAAITPEQRRRAWAAFQKKARSILAVSVRLP